MTDHHLKIGHFWFALQRDGLKPFEVRNNDRDFKTGDWLILGAWDDHASRYTGECLAVEVLRVYRALPHLTLQPGYVILATGPPIDVAPDYLGPNGRYAGPPREPGL